MLMFVFRLAGSDLHQLRLQRVDRAQKSLDTLNFSGSTVRRFHRAVPEVLLHSEEVDPALGYGEADHHVLARYLAQFSGCKTRHENIRPQLHLITRETGSSASQECTIMEVFVECRKNARHLRTISNYFSCLI